VREHACEFGMDGGCSLRIIFIGDIVGQQGVMYTKEILKELIPSLKPDLIIANGENASNGKGLKAQAAEELYEAGVEIITLGNHTFDQKETLHFISDDLRIVRPANYPPGTPGNGFTVCRVNREASCLIINLMGRTFLSQLDCPFRTVDEILERNPTIRFIVVDMHAEVTSEKLAMGWYLDGRVSVVVGTHTHVPTADARILPQGTAYMTDVGMVGPRDGILGMQRDIVIKKLRTQLPVRFEVADGPRQFCGTVIDLDDNTGRATSIEPIFRAEQS